MNRISQNTLIALSLSLTVFVFTIWLSPFYTDGDPLLYSYAYNRMPDLDIVNSYVLYSILLSSKELVHFLISWCAAQVGMSRDLLNALSSGLLAYLIADFLIKKSNTFFYPMIIVLTNSYAVLLYTTTERLKYAMIFFLLSIISTKKPAKFYIFIMLAVISHIQILVLYVSLLSYKLYFTSRTLSFKDMFKNLSKYTFLILIPILLVFDQIVTKFDKYSGHGSGIIDILQGLVFFFLSFVYARDRKEVIVMYIPLILFIFILGGARLNIFAYFLFLHFIISGRRGSGIILVITSIYYLVSSIFFIEGIIYTGAPAGMIRL